MPLMPLIAAAWLLMPLPMPLMELRCIMSPACRDYRRLRRQMILPYASEFHTMPMLPAACR